MTDNLSHVEVPMGGSINQSELKALYDHGRRVDRTVTRLLASAWDEQAAVTKAAGEAGGRVAEVRTAYKFARHVDAIASVVPKARKLILAGGNPHLTPRVVADVVKRFGTGADGRSREGMRTAMGRAAAGLHPLAPPPPEGLPAGVAPWHRDLTRLRTAIDLLDRVLTALSSSGRALAAAEVADLAVHAAALRVDAEALRQVVGRGRNRLSGDVSNPTAGARAHVVGFARKARGLVDRATGDLVRASHTHPLDAVRADLASAVGAVATRAVRIAGALPSPAAVPPPTARADPGGPSKAGGTYVIVYHAEAAGVVRLGRLGTFRLPAGYLLYVGSAFQGGGVAFRTGRHIGGVGPRLWNADYLWGFARPVERWWTHHGDEVEHTWARALAEMKGFSCPAPGAGANDCKGVGDRRQCPAHLYHVLKRPSCRAFAGRLGAAGSGGYGISYQRVSETTPLSRSNATPAPMLTVW